MADAPKRTNRRPYALAFIAGSCVAWAGGPLIAGSVLGGYLQPDSQTSTKSFDEIDFAIAPIAGALSMNAQAGWIWREGDTHRIVLHQDVDVTISDHRFNANGAGIWLRKLSSDAQRGTTRYQIFAVFEDMRSGDGTISMTARQLPVRGVIETDRPIEMSLVARFDAPPGERGEAGLLMARTERLYAQRVLGVKEPGQTRATEPRPWAAPMDQSTQDETATGVPPTPGLSDERAADVVRGPIFEPDGVFSVAIGGRIVIDGAAEGRGSVITADGGVTLQYQAASSGQWVDFRAERVVIYTAGDEPISGVSSFGTSQIEGIYLEGGVFAGDDQWSVRSPRMYLDVANNRALMIDTVFWTTDQRSSMPLYVRAAQVRQTARQEFTASQARISNTAFFEPDLTIGISDITVTMQDPPADEGAPESPDPMPSVTVAASNVTLNAGPVPFLWLPGFKGDPSDFPLRRVQVGDSNRSGLVLSTRWNALSLFRIDAPPGVRLDIDFDYYGERGFATGLSGDWRTREHRGGLFSYLLIDDTGTDITASGREISRDGETRGIFAFHDLWEFTNKWTLVSELSYISDEAFIPAFFDDMGRTTEDFRNRLQLERRGEDNYFALELSTTLNDFIAAEHLLQSPGYRVQKMPEARFVSLTKDLLPDYDPGLLTYSFEARAGLMQLAFSEVTAAEYGFTTDSLADAAFGTLASESLSDQFRGIGLDESAVQRYDTRHELTARLDLGPLRISPFLVGRATAYDSSFDEYSPDQNERMRFWGAGGVTLSTTLQKVNDSIENRFFDIHRMRHIVEPSITIWGSGSNFDADDVPIFDDDVEGLLEGTMVRAAVDQTWQTKRGGVGRWRDVDLVRLRTEYVWSSDNAGNSPIPDFYSARPELSRPGEYAGVSMIVQPTEVLALAGEMIYDMETNEIAKSSIGTILQHRPGFSTSIEYREVEPLDAAFATIGANYRLSDKYAITTRMNYNFRFDDFQHFDTQILRRFQIGTLGASLRYDNIREETSVGFVFRPLGSGGDLRADPSWGG
ncbi:MAG: LPS assembly protein LptD [Phycisphaerales bacterium]